MSHPSTRTTALHRTPVLFCLILVCAVAAQAQVTGYPGKFICGFEPGNVPLLNNPTPLMPPRPYENFKPGNYATVFNVLNLNPTVEEVHFVFTTGNLPAADILTVMINPFTSVQVGCQIANPFIPPLIGQRFEGMLVPVTNNSNFIVDAVYTFESQNAFERHVIYEPGNSPSTLGVTLRTILDDFTAPVSNGLTEAASGAGGLGLGASIDVERLDPVSIVPTFVEEASPDFPLPLESGDG